MNSGMTRNRVLAFDGQTLTCLDLPMGLLCLPFEKRTLPFQDRNETTSVESLVRMKLAPNEVAILWNHRDHWTIHDRKKTGLHLGPESMPPGSKGLAFDAEEWKARHQARLVSRGLDESFARDTTSGCEVDLSMLPEDCADDELWYMAQDTGDVVNQ